MVWLIRLSMMSQLPMAKINLIENFTDFAENFNFSQDTEALNIDCCIRCFVIDYFLEISVKNWAKIE